MKDEFLIKLTQNPAQNLNVRISAIQPIIVGFEKLKRQNFHESVHFKC